jgi:aminoglycoside phosphotransferase family enzyme/predicted kinase
MGGQDETLAFLRAALAGEQGGPVETIETHISIVLMAGERAWKLKRAVRLPYVDFSTPDLRLAAARTELALNRRTAPGLYLGLRRIARGADGGLRFGDGGGLVDAVVEMRRFDQAMLFDQLARRDALTRPMLTDLARAVARFHAEAEAAHGLGGAASIKSVLDLNARALRDSGLVSQAEAEAQAARFREVHARFAPLLDARARAGKIRRCHGDLNLRNICLHDGAPTPFDCLEFDEALATVDVLYDLAFLLMDLWEHGRRAEANWVFNRYLDAADETDGLPLAPFFMAMRAAVRAHVTATQAKEHPERRAEALVYHRLADELLAAHPPRLIAIGGLSGAGKSTLAATLAPDIGPPPGARILASDRLRKARAGVAAETRLPAEAYTPQASRDIYLALNDETARVLATGYAVVVDAVFARQDERARMQAVAERAGAGFSGLWLDADRSVLRARVAARRNDASDATVDVVDKQSAYDLGALDWPRLDAGADDLVVRARAALGLTS